MAKDFDKVARDMVKDLTSDLTRAHSKLLAAKINAERGAQALSTEHPDLWEKARGIAYDLELLVNEINEARRKEAE